MNLNDFLEAITEYDEELEAFLDDFDFEEDIVDKRFKLNESNELISYEGDEESVVIPSYVKKIGEKAFYHSKVKHVSFESDTLIGPFAFWGSSIESIYLLECKQTRIEDYTFAGCNRLRKIFLPDHVEYIGRHAFEGCTKLSKLYFPKHLKMIDEEAFKNTGLISVELNAQLIEFGAFAACKKLRRVKIGDNVEVIGECAFQNCFLLHYVELSDQKLLMIGDGAFLNVPRLNSIRIPKTVMDMGAGAFEGIKNLKAEVPKHLEDHVKAYYKEVENPKVAAPVIWGERDSQIFDTTARITYY